MLGLYHALTVRFPTTTFVRYAELTLGKWGGRAVALLYFSYFYLLSALVLRNIGDFLTTQVLPETPIQIIHAFFLLVVILGVREGIGRWRGQLKFFSLGCCCFF